MPTIKVSPTKSPRKKTPPPEPKHRGGKRPGAGRPPILTDAVKLWLWISRADLKALDRSARRAHIDRSEFIRRACRDAIEQIEKENKNHNG